MQVLLMVLIVLHVLPGVFWVGSTFVLARSGGAGAESLTLPQLAAAGVVIASGLGLWSQTHAGGFGPAEQVLAVGAMSAVLALGIQAAIVLPSVGALAASNGDVSSGARRRIAVAEKLAAGLLGITVVCMVVARYV